MQIIVPLRDHKFKNFNRSPNNEEDDEQQEESPSVTPEHENVSLVSMLEMKAAAEPDILAFSLPEIEQKKESRKENHDIDHEQKGDEDLPFITEEDREPFNASETDHFNFGKSPALFEPFSTFAPENVQNDSWAEGSEEISRTDYYRSLLSESVQGPSIIFQAYEDEEESNETGKEDVKEPTISAPSPPPVCRKRVYAKVKPSLLKLILGLIDRPQAGRASTK
jgi:hypothetical protein